MPNPLVTHLQISLTQTQLHPNLVDGVAGKLLADHFWRQFFRNYLPSLETRQKCMSETDNLRIGKTKKNIFVDPQLPCAL